MVFVRYQEGFSRVLADLSDFAGGLKTGLNQGFEKFFTGRIQCFLIDGVSDGSCTKPRFQDRMRWVYRNTGVFSLISLKKGNLFQKGAEIQNCQGLNHCNLTNHHEKTQNAVGVFKNRGFGLDFIVYWLENVKNRASNGVNLLRYMNSGLLDFDMVKSLRTVGKRLLSLEIVQKWGNLVLKNANFVFLKQEVEKRQNEGPFILKNGCLGQVVSFVVDQLVSPDDSPPVSHLFRGFCYISSK